MEDSFATETFRLTASNLGPSRPLTADDIRAAVRKMREIEYTPIQHISHPKYLRDRRWKRFFCVTCFMWHSKKLFGIK